MHFPHLHGDINALFVLGLAYWFVVCVTMLCPVLCAVYFVSETEYSNLLLLLNRKSMLTVSFLLLLSDDSGWATSSLRNGCLLITSPQFRHHFKHSAGLDICWPTNKSEIHLCSANVKRWAMELLLPHSGHIGFFASLRLWCCSNC